VAWKKVERLQGRLRRVAWLGWLLLVPLCGSNALVLAALKGLPGVLLVPADVAFFVLPPALAVSTSGWLAYAVYARIRGPRWTAGELLCRPVSTRISGRAPLLLGAAAFGAFLDKNPRLSVLLLLAAAVARRAGRLLGTVTGGLSLRGLGPGELRRRIFA